eukprot:CAMPEP_0119014086 /NCGR_PEP_ID=MMETSP1176-20130426/9344_1 /TAXON_ID=265551 /ORGANISM="Synedropsis recta cf, Strain CCMP1620" /LENGTH=699 /DNA_ID=CAMNT_0006967225 /DNA_START=59 /DNA_END=2158 /DNA_ORIENTATION=-
MSYPRPLGLIALMLWCCAVNAQDTTTPFQIGIGVGPGVPSNPTCSEHEKAFIAAKVKAYVAVLGRLFFKDEFLEIVEEELNESDSSSFNAEAFEDFNTYEAKKFTEAVASGDEVAKVIYNTTDTTDLVAAEPVATDTEQVVLTDPVVVLTTVAPVAQDPVTRSPVVDPTTNAPVVVKMEARVASTTSAPLAPMTDAPVAPMTEAPVVPMTEAPVESPTVAPVVPMTEAPVATPTVPSISKFVLYDAGIHVKIRDMQEGDTLYLGDLPEKLTIVAVSDPPDYDGSVKFTLNNPWFSKTEGNAPYALNGDYYDATATSPLRYKPATEQLQAGDKHLVAKPYRKISWWEHEHYTSLSIDFRVVDGHGPVADEPPAVTDGSDSCVDTCVSVDFDTLPDGTPIERGAYISDEWKDAYGLTITVEGNDELAYTPTKPGTNLKQGRIFDSSIPERDWDMGSPNEACDNAGPGVGAGGSPGSNPYENCVPQGNLLIIQEDEITKPNGNTHGGEFRFAFDRPAKVDTLGLMDVSSTGYGEIKIFFSDGTSKTKKIDKTGRNSVQNVEINEVDVIQVIVYMYEDAAVTKIDFCVPLCTPETASGRQLQQEQGHRELPSSYGYRWGGAGSYTCRLCNGDTKDSRTRNLRGLLAFELSDVKAFLVGALETFISLGMSMHLKGQVEDYLVQQGLEYGCFGNGDEIQVVFELL